MIKDSTFILFSLQEQTSMRSALSAKAINCLFWKDFMDYMFILENCQLNIDFGISYYAYIKSPWLSVWFQQCLILVWRQFTKQFICYKLYVEIANWRFIWFGLGELLCLDQEPLSVQI